MIQTINGCFSFKWDHTYYFLDCNYSSFCEAIMKKEIQTLSEIACLEEDHNGHFIKSNWSTVKNFKDLKNYIIHINKNHKGSNE